MNWETYEAYLLSIVVWREARGESRPAKIAVACSILNRVIRPSWWGDSISAVISKKWQYSSMSASGDPNLIRWPSRPDPAFEECMAVVDDVLAQRIKNPMPGADSYFDDSIPPPKWADEAKRVGKLGHFSFYNLDQDQEVNQS